VLEVTNDAGDDVRARYTHLEIEDLQAQVADLPANHSGGVG